MRSTSRTRKYLFITVLLGAAAAAEYTALFALTYLEDSTFNAVCLIVIGMVLLFLADQVEKS